MLNVAALMGRLTANPELKYTSSGLSVTTFTIAVERSFVRQGEERQADFIDIVAWRNTAEFVCKYFKKGSMIAISGSIQTRTYQDKNGNNRKAVEILANNVNFAGSKENNHSEGVGKMDEQPSYPPTNNDFTVIDDQEDLPF